MVCQSAGQPAWFIFNGVNGLNITQNHGPLFVYTNVTNLNQSLNVLNQGVCSVR